MTDHTDLRVIKTLDAIHSTLETMICEMDYQSISVTELCEHARINKKTFYRYYTSLDELQAEFRSEMASAYIELTKEFRFQRDIPKVSKVFFEFLESKPVYSHITCAPSYGLEQKRLTDIVPDDHWKDSPALANLPASEQSLVIAYVRSMGAAIYRQWVTDGRKVPIERAIEITAILQSQGLSAMLS